MHQNTLGARGGNITFSKGGLRGAQITGHYNEFQVQNNVVYSVDGVMNTLASVDNVNTALAAETYSLPANGQVPACNAVLFALWVNNTNAIAVTRGAYVDATKLTGTGRSGQLAIPYPELQANNALFGLIKVVAGTGTSFNFGTTNYNATNITATFYDVSSMPVTPLTS